MGGLCQHCGMALSEVSLYPANNTENTEVLRTSTKFLPVQVPSFGVVLCAQKVSEKHPNVTIKYKDLAALDEMCAQKHQKVLHEVLVMIVGQDSGDVPVSRGQGLKYVGARVRLEENSA